ncbi:hypothetical protein BD410DRAFT_742136 [Rickenella mellea]|uniref:BTB domain-containing protein n=1 Tax=Rickenella mellea TaxID=50990 RepID=A0A4Y7QGB9_9AGAM|nr:hypothetical protein BD410DRAFT_742136 [Rickenella mellea]
MPPLFDQGDLILRTADAVQYHVWSKILTVASPFFRDLFNLPQPKDQDGIPVVDVSEDSTVIVELLHIIYPVKCQPMTNVELIRKVLGAALKYDVSLAVQEICGLLATRHSSSGEDALRTYAITCHYKIEEEARLAAKATLQFPIIDVYVEELEPISAGDLSRLLQYRQAAFSVIEPLFHEWITNEFPRAIFGGKCSPCVDDIWKEFSLRAKAALREAPHSETICNIRFMTPVYQSKKANSYCSHNVHDQWTSIHEYLKTEIDRRIDTVELSVRF